MTRDQEDELTAELISVCFDASGNLSAGIADVEDTLEQSSHARER